jgi:hypothetical protein
MASKRAGKVRECNSQAIFGAHSAAMKTGRGRHRNGFRGDPLGKLAVDRLSVWYQNVGTAHL